MIISDSFQSSDVFASVASPVMTDRDFLSQASPIDQTVLPCRIKTGKAKRGREGERTAPERAGRERGMCEHSRLFLYLKAWHNPDLLFHSVDFFRSKMELCKLIGREDVL